MKIFCIGRNYADHAKELQNKIPTRPLIFMKPQTALVKHNAAVYYPDFTKNLHYECELVLKIGKQGKSVQEQYALDYISEVTVGIDFTARDLQSELKAKGHSWEIAKAFDHSAPVGQFIAASSIDNWADVSIELQVNGVTKQKGNTKDLLFAIPHLIAYISRFFTLQTGDLIFTGTPAGVGPVEIGDQLTAYLDGEKLLSFDIK